MFLRPRRSGIPSFNAVLWLEVEEKGEERTIVLIHSAALSPVVVPDKESPHVPNNKRKSGCCRACRHHVVTLYVAVRSWLIDKQAKKMQPVQVVVGEAVLTWPGAGRCCRTITDVHEPSKKRQLFIFSVPCVRLLSNDADWDSESRLRSLTQGAAKQPFSRHGPSRHPEISKLFRLELSRHCNRTE